MNPRFVIRSRRVLVGSEGEPRPSAVVVENGKIAAITEYDAFPAGVETIEGGDRVLMSGIFDTHAHINEPGRTDWEGFQTATRAAAAGGITSVIDMPLNSIPATTTLSALHVKAETAAGKCAIDYGFWGGVVPGNAAELEPMVKAGALGFKCFLIESGVDEFPMSTEADLRIAMPILARLGVPLLVHAELDLHRSGGALPPGKDERSYGAYLESRPPNWEVEAIRMMIRLARETGCRTHIVHLSASAALADLREAKRAGVPISVETCPHYLYFDAEKIDAGATHYKCAPPIREHANREALWAGLRDGTIDFVVSDHSPCSPALKLASTGDFGKAWGGISGLQFSLSVVWTEARKRGFTSRDVSRWMSEGTAIFAGRGSRNGTIAVGKDADLVLWEPEASFRLKRDMIYHRHAVTPYAEFEFYGKVARTIVRGRTVYADGGFPEAAAIGTQLKRMPEA
ncbi:MAG: allantoinase AllB [Bdellovibrionales bacterium]|nr:allantoinase AllB [Bdellovibrionales bacterium]